jgi:hypothetical protein
MPAITLSVIVKIVDLEISTPYTSARCAKISHASALWSTATGPSNSSSVGLCVRVQGLPSRAMQAYRRSGTKIPRARPATSTAASPGGGLRTIRDVIPETRQALPGAACCGGFMSSARRQGPTSQTFASRELSSRPRSLPVAGDTNGS